MNNTNYNKSTEEIIKRTEIVVNGCIGLYLNNGKKYDLGIIFGGLEKDSGELRPEDISGYFNTKIGEVGKEVNVNKKKFLEILKRAKNTGKRLGKKRRDVIYQIMESKEISPAEDYPEGRVLF